MRRLFWLALGFVLAWYGFGLVSAGDGFATYRLRDGLIVALVGAVIFAWQSRPFLPLPFVGGERQWPLWGRILTGTGVICGAASAVLMALWGDHSWAAYLGGSLWAIGALALLAGLLWPGRVEIYPTPTFRWRVDAAGNYVRYALDDPNQPIGASLGTTLVDSTRTPLLYWILAALIILGGILLRLWRINSLPNTCVDVECALALRLVEGGWPQGFHAEALSLFGLLTGYLFRWTGESIGALRWAGVILGSLALPVIFWAARAYMKPAGALVALLTMALLPWAVWSSRFGTVWSAAPLLVALTLGLAGNGLQRPNYRWWGMTGVALALLLMQPWPLWGATIAWMLALAGAAVWAQAQTPGQSVAQTQRGAWRASIDYAAVMVGCALALGLPLALPSWQASSSLGMASSDRFLGALSLVAGLLDGGGATLDYFARNPLLPAWAAALGFLGLATLLRWVRQPRAAIVAAGLLLYGAALLLVIPPMVSAGGVAATSTALLALPIVSASEAWLLLLPFIALASGVAADQLITTFDRAWSILLPLPRVVTVVTLLLVLLAGQEAMALMGQLGRAGGNAQNEAEVAMGQYLAECLRGQTSDTQSDGAIVEVTLNPCRQQGQGAPIFYVPPATVNHPATRLLLGAALESGRVRAFEPSRDLLPSTTPTGDLFYLVAIENQPVIELLRQLYPGATMQAEPMDQAGPTLFLVIQIPLSEVLADQGLEGKYYAGDQSPDQATATPELTRMDGPLQFAWSSEPPLDGPFNVLWEGSLLVATDGAYSFAIDDLSGLLGELDAPVISLQLDGNLLLDSSLGLNEKTEQLAQGAYQFTMRYRTTGPTGDWALLWTPPNGAAHAIPRQQLYSPPLPNIGLIGTYYAGSNWDGEVLSVRKDLVLGAPVDLPQPYSVAWNGKIAASRAGEYFFAVTANGPVTLAIDGRDVLLHTPSPDPATGAGYSQAGIYLDQGWHTIDLRYAPAGQSDLRLLWQPPGSGPLLLASRYLVPTQAPITVVDLALPAPPELVDPTLGDDRFALSANMGAYQPTQSIPPANLPLLVSEPVWTLANGCGAGDTQFASPRGIAADGPNGRIYVADSENRRVVELMLADGSLVTTYDLPEFQEPVDVALAPNGSLLVLDATAQNIFRIDRATRESAALALGTTFYHPRGFAVDPVGNIAVADTGGARVALLDATGALLAQYGGIDTPLGQGQPTDTLALGDQLWTIAADHGRLWRMNSLGSVSVTDRASTVTGPQLAALPDGSAFFMSDPVRRTVLYFTPNGQPLAQLGYSDLFAGPMGVDATFGDDGFVNLVVGDNAACTVSLWRLRTR